RACTSHGLEHPCGSEALTIDAWHGSECTRVLRPQLLCACRGGNRRDVHLRSALYGGTRVTQYLWCSVSPGEIGTRGIADCAELRGACLSDARETHHSL